MTTKQRDKTDGPKRETKDTRDTRRDDTDPGKRRETDLSDPERYGTKEDLEKALKEREKEKERLRKKYDRIGKDDDNPRAIVTPWLVMRYQDADVGLRPIPPGHVFWQSPDIWVEGPDPLGRPVAGQPNTVMARIFNFGAFDAVPVKVDFYWGDPSVGLGAAHMNLIGSAFTEVRSLHAVTVPCPKPWVPVLVNGGHECLKVNCSNWVADPIINPFKPKLDRHVGQRNVQVIQMAAGEATSIMLNLNNTLPRTMKARLVADVRHLRLAKGRPQALDRALLDHLLGFGMRPARPAIYPLQAKREGHDDKEKTARKLPRYKQVPMKFGGAWVQADLGETSRFFDIGSGDKDPRDTASRDVHPFETVPPEAPDREPLTILRTKLERGEQRPLKLTVGAPGAARPADAVLYRITLMLGDTVAGGYTVFADIR